MLLNSLRTIAALGVRRPHAVKTFNGVLPAISRFEFSTSSIARSSSSSSGESSAEARMIEILRSRFPEATDLAVVDISGGCGSMYEVHVEAPDFAGLRMVKSHKMVTDALKAEIKEMHGLRVSTMASPKPCGGGDGASS